MFDSESVGDLSTRPSALLKMTHCGWFWFPCLGGKNLNPWEISPLRFAPVEMTNIHEYCGMKRQSDCATFICRDVQYVFLFFTCQVDFGMISAVWGYPGNPLCVSERDGKR